MVPAASPEPAGKQDRHPILDQIASTVEKESLVPVLHALAGARMQGDALILDFGPNPNEFFRRQLKDNLALVEKAAETVVGRKVRIQLDDMQTEVTRPQNGPSAVEEDILTRAKKNPVVRSFLDSFPGPVKAEKIKP